MNLTRQIQFLFEIYSEDTIRYDITEQSDTKLLGESLGKFFLESFKTGTPVKGMYVFGRIGMGKTVLSTAIINSFENTKDLLIDVKHRVDYRYYDTYPACHHVDYYRFGRTNFPCNEQIQLKENEMIIAEWADNLIKRNKLYFEEDRIDIELYHCFDKKNICKELSTPVFNKNITAEGSMRFASLVGYGNGIQVIKKLKKDKNLQHMIVDSSELD